jgi:hypothetical protein
MLERRPDGQALVGLGRKWKFGLAALLALALAVPGASRAQARVSNAEVKKSLEIAYDYWDSITNRTRLPGFHCQRGNVGVVWHRDMGSAMASATLGGCTEPVPKVNLEEPTIRGLDDDHACAVITHEFGHLLGYPHNKTKNSIMYTSANVLPVSLLTPHAATWERAYNGQFCGRL